MWPSRLLSWSAGMARYSCHYSCFFGDWGVTPPSFTIWTGDSLTNQVRPGGERSCDGVEASLRPALPYRRSEKRGGSTGPEGQRSKVLSRPRALGPEELGAVAMEAADASRRRRGVFAVRLWVGAAFMVMTVVLLWCVVCVVLCRCVDGSETSD